MNFNTASRGGYSQLNNGNQRRSGAETLIDLHDSSMDISTPIAEYNGKQQDGFMSSTIYPFPKKPLSFPGLFCREFKSISRKPQTRKILGLMLFNIVVTILIFLWCQPINSLALIAFSLLNVIDLLIMCVGLVTIWVRTKTPSSSFTYGFERFEVLAVFSTTVLAIFGSMFIFMESLEHLLLIPWEAQRGRGLLWAGLTLLLLHLLMTYSLPNIAVSHVISASASGWLQEYCAHFSRSLCSVIPGLDKLLLPRLNPLALVGFAGYGAFLVSHLLIETNGYLSADPIAAFCIAVLIVITMVPMATYTARILLQTTPSHVVAQLDKCTREALTLDGVLEFKNEHFWTLSFGKLVGSLHVRVRRDANEQLVLAHVTNKFSGLVSHLTVQIFKDEWTRQPFTSHLINLDSASLPPPPAALPKSLQQPYMGMPSHKNVPYGSRVKGQHFNPSDPTPLTTIPSSSTLYGMPTKNMPQGSKAVGQKFSLAEPAPLATSTPIRASSMAYGIPSKSLPYGPKAMGQRLVSSDSTPLAASIPSRASSTPYGTPSKNLSFHSDIAPIMPPPPIAMTAASSSLDYKPRAPRAPATMPAIPSVTMTTGSKVPITMAAKYPRAQSTSKALPGREYLSQMNFPDLTKK